MRVIITAGGTGGHIYPAISILNKIKEEMNDAEYLVIACTAYDKEIDGLYKNIKIKNEKFFCDLVFDFYDHFGLDSQDLVSFDWIPSVRIGFQGWYILQHFKDCETGCKAFVNHANFSEKMEVQIES